MAMTSTDSLALEFLWVDSDKEFLEWLDGDVEAMLSDEEFESSSLSWLYNHANLSTPSEEAGVGV